MPKKIERVEIKQLFGRFNYDLNLGVAENSISILTAPNGYGKSTILKIISSFASGDHFYFIKGNFTHIRFYITGEAPIEIIHLEDDIENNQVTIRNGVNQSKIKDPFGNQDGGERAFVVERALPFLTRIGVGSWRHDRTGEIFNRAEILERYGDHPVFRRNVKRDEWLENIRKSLNVFSIPTNRLKLEEDFNDRGHLAAKSSLMVGAIAKEIQDKIQTAIRNQFETGRKKETSFPTRLIESLKEGGAPSRDSIMELIKSVQDYEKRYSRLGLVPHTGTTEQLNIHAGSTESAGMLVLKTYLDDIREKFSLLDDLAQQLDIFCNSINGLIAFKSIETSADEGIVMREKGGQKTANGENKILSLPVLSSGEQHLIVLIGKLVFNTDKGSLVLIDEPEISFHPEWQEKFLGILEDVRKLNGFSALIATHSPILIGDRWASVIELAEQHQESLI